MNGMTSPAARTSPVKGVYLARVLANTPLCREHWRLVLALDAFPEARPGQFQAVRPPDDSDPDEVDAGG